MSAFDHSELEQHRAEAQEKWGRTAAYQEHHEKTKHYSKQKWDELAAGMDRIMEQFAVCMRAGNTPNSDEALSLVKLLQSHITENYYLCTDEILAGLGQMYIADPRFRENIDRHADGTAAFISQAIEACFSR